MCALKALSIQIINCVSFISTVLLPWSRRRNDSSKWIAPTWHLNRRYVRRTILDAHEKPIENLFAFIHRAAQYRQVISRRPSLPSSPPKSPVRRKEGGDVEPSVFFVEEVNLRISTRSILLFRRFRSERKGDGKKREVVPASFCRPSVDFKPSIVEFRVPPLRRAKGEVLVLPR